MDVATCFYSSAKIVFIANTVMLKARLVMTVLVDGTVRSARDAEHKDILILFGICLFIVFGYRLPSFSLSVEPIRGAVQGVCLQRL